uniref:Uncharacterized protein n=1 Tax=Solanum tuberosum TaxID=4113 RepID=M1DIH4_SOLTU
MANKAIIRFALFSSRIQRTTRENAGKTKILKQIVELSNQITAKNSDVGVKSPVVLRLIFRDVNGAVWGRGGFKAMQGGRRFKVVWGGWDAGRVEESNGWIELNLDESNEQTELSHGSNGLN